VCRSILDTPCILYTTTSMQMSYRHTYLKLAVQEGLLYLESNHCHISEGFLTTLNLIWEKSTTC